MHAAARAGGEVMPCSSFGVYEYHDSAPNKQRGVEPQIQGKASALTAISQGGEPNPAEKVARRRTEKQQYNREKKPLVCKGNKNVSRAEQSRAGREHARLLHKQSGQYDIANQSQRPPTNGTGASETWLAVSHPFQATYS